MSEARDVLAFLIERMTEALEPLRALDADPEALETVLRTLGFDISRATVDLTSALASLDLARGAIEDIRSLSEDERGDVLVTSPLYASALARLADVARDVGTALRALPGLVPTADVSASRIVTELLLSHLARRAPALYPILVAGGVIDLEITDDPSVPGTDIRVRQILRWENLAALLRGDHSVLADRLGWNVESVSNAVPAILLAAMRLAEQHTAHVRGRTLPRAVEQRLTDREEIPLDADEVPQILIGLRRSLGGLPGELGLSLFALRDPEQATRFEGIGLAPFARGSIDVLRRAGQDDAWAIGVEGQLDATGGIALHFRPSEPPDLVTSAQRIAAEARTALTVERVFPPEAPPLASLPGGSTLRVGAVRLAMGAKLAERSPLLRAELRDISLSLALGEADSFVGSILPGGGIEATFDLAASWRRGGLSIEGGGGLSVTLPLHVSLGPVEVFDVTLAPGMSGDGASVETTASIRAALGPLTAVIEGIGARLGLTPGEPGEFPIQPVAGFRPPRGIGLSIESGPVSGGGYLFIDVEKGEYAGALQLRIGEIGVTAVGLLNTRLPDGDDGFSLVVIVTGSFPPVQLGFGFTLNALGGLLGINRTTNVDVLREGLRARTLDSLMFPKDPVANAPRVLADLGAAFPMRRGQHVFGPMAELGWGTPRVLSAELGLLLELDSPLRLILLGQLKAGLPSLEVEPRIAAINMDVLGVIDFARREASLDAALYDSRIAVYALEGEMAMRLRWGSSPFFALSLGGVHPAFERPPELPDLRRLAISLGRGNNPRLRLEAYLALTSNTVQFGARLDAYAKAMGFSAQGWLSFDALFVLEPFSFSVRLSAGVELKRGRRSIMRVSLDLRLSGPNPYEANGVARAEILFLDVKVDFKATFGSRREVALPPGDPYAALSTALARAGNWRATLPERTEGLVALVGNGAEDGALHPLGTLGVRQRIMPLGITIETFGALDPGDVRYCEIAAVRITIGGRDRSLVPDDGPTPLREMFAPAQFFDLSEDEKLTAPSFEPMRAGAGGFGFNGHVAPSAVVGSPLSAATSKRIERATAYVLPDGGAGTAFGEGAKPREAASAELIAASADIRAPEPEEPPRGFDIEAVRYGLFATRTMKRIEARGRETWPPVPELAEPGADSYAGARAAMRAHLRRHPIDEGELQVAPLGAAA